MSLSLTLASALSGLRANARASELVSTNVANAQTDGYGRRDIQLTARSLGGTGSGVAITGVLRVTDQVLLSDRRVAEANASGEAVSAGFFARIETAIGTPQDSASIGQKVNDLEAALLAASSRPDSAPRLQDVLDASTALVTHLNAASAAVQDERARADDRISQQVLDLNDSLAKVADLNQRILKQVAADRDASPLMDQRQQLIDRIATIVPIRETNRENGQVALVTTGGAILVDGRRQATFGFTPVGVVTPDMTIASGALSGLTMNGKPVRFGEGTEAMDGGALAADFRLRDRDAPMVQTQLDALARDLIARVADPGVDPTLGPTSPGLLTDGGAPLDPANEIGLSLRISVNAAVDPTRGGALWRLRSGIAAASEGSPGQSSILQALRQALIAPVNPASGGFAPGERSAAGLTSDLLSTISQARVRAEADQSFASARYDSLRSDELALGVDTDQQLQTLFQIERSYAANAKVVGAVDEMLKILLGM